MKKYSCLLVLWFSILTLASDDIPGPEHVHAISGGFASTNRVYIAIGNNIFYDQIPDCPATAGLYVVAVYENEVLLQCFYHTFQIESASEGLARDFEKLPVGTLVVVAGKDEPTRFFDERGQQALYQIGASVGLLGQPFRVSYLCIGIKGQLPGEAIELIGMNEQQYIGADSYTQLDLAFPEVPEPNVSSEPGIHEGLKIGETEAIYYIPEGFDPNTAEYFFAIHGAGDWHRPGAMTHIYQFKQLADRENLVLVAPAFDSILNWEPIRPDDFDEHGNFKDRRIIKNRYLWDFVGLLNHWNGARSDQKLIEIFNFFNKKLMQRDNFHLYGHSGGGQFVARFALFYPELPGKVAVSSAGTFAFPRHDVDYPYGLKMDNLKSEYPVVTDFNDIALDVNQLDEKLAAMLNLNLALAVGERETELDDSPQAWQGHNTLEKTLNFYEEMVLQDQILKDRGLRDPNKPFSFELYVLPNTGHDALASGQAVGRILFPGKIGDLNDDGLVNFVDIGMLCSQWLLEGSALSGDLAPWPTGDRIVNFSDLAAFCQQWLTRGY